ncbi:MAG TPA: hypothetical protein VIY52_18995 [Streptosporangiaceae bacterium]
MQLTEDDMENTPANRIEELLRSAFPEGTIERVQVLTYGDDPKIEPGETGIRVFIGRAGRPEGEEADKEIIQAFEEANRAVLKQLRDKLPAFIGWIHFQPDMAGEPPRARGIPVLSIGLRGRGAMAPDELTEQLTPVNTRLGVADLATVDTLITAGIANSRAEVLRWAIGRIRENPAYAQLQDRVHEINELKTKF